MPTEKSYDRSGRVTSMKIGQDVTDDQVAAAEAKSAAQDTTRLKAKAETDMPRPGPGEDMMNPAYRERLRKWREDKGRSTAIKDKMTGKAN